MGKSNVKGTKALQALVTQIDSILPTLTGKPAADVICEKGSILRTLLEIEQHVEERQAEQHDVDQAGKIAELTQELSVATVKNRELEQETATLKTRADNPKIVTVSDPEAAKVRKQKAALENIIVLLIASMSDEARTEMAVRINASCSPEMTELFCKLAKTRFDLLVRMLRCPEAELKRLSVAKGPEGVVIRSILKVNYNYPPPAPVAGAPTGFIPDTRSGEERLRDAKASVRSGL
jgi:hypothetical protein